jgi:hypothetical protein
LHLLDFIFLATMLCYAVFVKPKKHNFTMAHRTREIPTLAVSERPHFQLMLPGGLLSVYHPLDPKPILPAKYVSD